MDMLWLKAFHIMSAMIFIGGLLILSIMQIILTDKISLPAARHTLISTVCKWDKRITTPALFLLWILGITLAISGDWFTSPWLMIKLVFVFILSALHGLLSGALKKAADKPDQPAPAFLHHSGLITLVGICGIVFLAVTRPF